MGDALAFEYNNASKYTTEMLGQDMEWSWKVGSPMSELMKELVANIPPKAIMPIALAFLGNNTGTIASCNFYYQFMGRHRDPFIGKYATREHPERYK